MPEIHSFLGKILLPSIQFLTMLIAIWYFFKLKTGYWKWFSVYLIIIFLQEFFWLMNPNIELKYREIYYILFGIPIQYLFLYWLYAMKSLKMKYLFILLSAVFLGILILALFLIKELREIYSLISNIGTLLLVFLFILESIKQIQTDDILKFKENKMFYINLGLILFYLGSYPYQIFITELYENHYNLWELYYLYFLVSNCAMYLLFAASFIWGKTR